MYLITQVKSRSSGVTYSCHFQNIDPATLKLDREYEPDFSQVNTYYKEKMDREDEYNGILREVGIDKNGNMILLFRSMTYTDTKYGRKYFYGDGALLTVSPSGKTISSAVFPASHYSEAGMGMTSTMLLVVGDNNGYVLFDNTVHNMELPETKNAKTLKDRGPAVPVKYTYANNAVKKEYMFKKPKEEKGNPYCDFSVSDYYTATKSFVVMYIDPEKDKACLMYTRLD
jgi:hypothetical protein